MAWAQFQLPETSFSLSKFKGNPPYKSALSCHLSSPDRERTNAILSKAPLSWLRIYHQGSLGISYFLTVFVTAKAEKIFKTGNKSKLCQRSGFVILCYDYYTWSMKTDDAILHRTEHAQENLVTHWKSFGRLGKAILQEGVLDRRYSTPFSAKTKHDEQCRDRRTAIRIKSDSFQTNCGERPRSAADRLFHYSWRNHIFNDARRLAKRFCAPIILSIVQALA